MHDADELLEWLCVALGWLGGGGLAEHHPYRPVLEASVSLYRGRWHFLLPCEREHAVDLALSLVCTAWSPRGVHLDPTSIIFMRFWYAVVRAQGSSRLDSHVATYERIELAVDHVRGLYNVALGLSSFAGFATVQKATEWATNFLGPAGLSREKAMRMDLRALEAISQRLDELRDELFALARAPGRAFPPVDDLPSADAALSHAEIQVAPRHAVYERLKHLFSNFVELYSDGNRIRIGPRDPRHAHDMANAALDLGRGDLEGSFDALDAEERHEHVQDARSALFTTCDELYRTGSLPAPFLLSSLGTLSSTVDLVHPRPTRLAALFAAFALTPRALVTTAQQHCGRGLINSTWVQKEMGRTEMPFADATNRSSTALLDGANSAPEQQQPHSTSTIKPRRPAPAPPSTGFAFPARPADTDPLPSTTRPVPVHRHTRSTSSISHPPIPDPSYPVRSQPIGVSRSSSLSSSSSFGSGLDLAALAAEPPSSSSPRKPDVHLRRLSLSDRSGSDADKDNKDVPARPRRPTPQKRSESLPAYPPPPTLSDKTHNGVSEQELAALPPNPKLWLPSHLSTYLSSTMSLPPPVRADITTFIRSSRLSGRTFLRLREADLDELGINIRWRQALLEARGVLRRESLGGRVLWGFEGAGSAAPPPAAAAAVAAAASHRRGGSWQGTCVDVEGSASEDESSKDEWKRSWRASQGVGVRDRVRGLRRAFETVEEASESGTPEKPASTRKALPTAWRHGRSDSAASDMSDASVDSAGGKYAAASATPSRVQQADDTFLSSTFTTSSSGTGRRSPFSLDLDLASPSPRLELDLSPAPDSPTSASSSHGTSLPFAAESPAPSRPPSCAPSAQTPRLQPDGTLRAASAKGGSARLVSFREFSSSSTTARGDARGDGESGEEDDDDDPTLRPVRSPLSSPPMSPRTGSLAELFGLDVPRVHAGDTPQRRTREDELVPMFVPGLPQPRGDEEDGGGSRRHSKKGSLVLVKKSQLAALQRRMSEVESQLALALGSEGTPSVGDDDEEGDDGKSWVYKGEQVDEERLREMQERIDGLELRTTHLATSIPASPTPSARAFASLDSPSASASSMSLSTAYPDTSAGASGTSRRRDKERQRSRSSTAQGSVYSVQTQEDLPGMWPIEGWRQLSGYVVAASIGIGIVAGEVVAAKILGLRRR
ncbi:uncharacterized protein RHOBADRAFT_54639 [Rhodotorula graminis WP1]|uniref:Uncharacterized protein n=1 Tax=Rhodotorula graminis (strain WP1) TaxID=578459 RepID=A0A0P9FE72_RHOGW|nr:uncharacterized protein RHOBADRAFT_54639 [Rhodotorula graminis WP1]KPV74078.1 hypothetical protein RHOBADRAFT_54639 [Rhodotorula graminis WP1]